METGKGGDWEYLMHVMLAATPASVVLDREATSTFQIVHSIVGRLP